MKQDGRFVPVTWAEVPLGEVASEQVDQSGPPGTGDFLYIDISSIDNRQKQIIDPKRLLTAEAPTRARQRVQPGDVLVSMTRPNLNAVAVVGEEFRGAVASTGFDVLRPREVEPRWLFYYVQSDQFVRAMSALVQGVVYPAVRPKDIRSHQIPLAPLPEQRRIVAAIEEHFTKLDAAVAALERVRANLRRYRASVLQAACSGRLIPTEAELARAEGRDYEPADELLQRVLKERRARWEAAELEKMQARGKPPKDDRWKAKYQEPAPPDTSELPELPEGWVWVSWQQIGFSQNGRAFPSSSYSKAGVKLLRPGNLYVDGSVGWTETNTRYLPPRWAEEYPGYLVGPRELVINLTAQSLKDEFLGRVCLTGPQERCLLNQRIARLSPVLVLPEYLLWMFKSKVFRRFVDGLNTGSLIQHMFTSQLDEFCLPLPPAAEQARIVAEVDRRLSGVEKLEVEVEHALARAGRLRQAILRRAFAGRLVPQDPRDEPASVLVERIRNGRAKEFPRVVNDLERQET